MSELSFAGKPLAEIAGYTSIQLLAVIARPRGKYGELVKDDGMPAFVKANLGPDGQWRITSTESFSGMFSKLKKSQGVPGNEVEEKYDEYLRKTAPRVAAAREAKRNSKTYTWGTEEGSRWERVRR